MCDSIKSVPAAAGMLDLMRTTLKGTTMISNKDKHFGKFVEILSESLLYTF
jgi:hypothetical protein